MSHPLREVLPVRWLVGGSRVVKQKKGQDRSPDPFRCLKNECPVLDLFRLLPSTTSLIDNRCQLQLSTYRVSRHHLIVRFAVFHGTDSDREEGEVCRRPRLTAR
jgi:hypothetical protein